MPQNISIIYLKPQREKSVLQRHPWIFASAIERIDGQPQLGETVEVRSSDKTFLAYAAYSPNSQIRARIWTWKQDDVIDADYFHRRLSLIIQYRNQLISTTETNSLRLVHGESDSLPGFIVDRYADTLVLQCLSAGAEYWRDVFVEQLQIVTGIKQIIERSDVDVRGLEGLSERKTVVSGTTPESKMTIQENDLRFWVDVWKGQKTGFFLDQRRNRQRMRELVKDRQVLNCFCYTGAFTVYALAGGAQSVLSIDSSAEALDIGKENITLNELPPEKALWQEGDVFQVLRGLRDRRSTFDAIILDPPKFAPTTAQAERASRGYKDINLLAFKLLRPGGLLFTFSCSGGISADLFQKIVAGAALDAGVQARIVEHLYQAPDHPIALNFPEGAYLKGLICQVD